MICFSSKKTKQNPVVFIMIFVYGCNSLFCFFVSLLPTCSGGSSFFSCYLVCLHIPVVSGLSLIQFSSTFILKVSSSCAFLCYSFLLLPPPPPPTPHWCLIDFTPYYPSSSKGTLLVLLFRMFEFLKQVVNRGECTGEASLKSHN